MEQRFLKYTTEQLLDEKDFTDWILNNEKDREWKAFWEKYPEFRYKVKEAREMVNLLADTHDELEEDALLSMWRDIDRYNRIQKKKSKKRVLLNRLPWAASVLLLVSIGLGGYFYLIKKDTAYHFSSSLGAENSNGQMVLSSGEEISLQQKHSAILMDDMEKQVIVNDSIIHLKEPERNQTRKTEMNEVIIPYGKSSELLLADGTKVWLNAGSRLAFPSGFSKDVREVYLEGEAYFEVAKKVNQPFVVKAGELEIEVLGTHFDVSAYPDADLVETILLEGSVSVNRKRSIGIVKEKTVLAPSQKANFHKESKSITVANVPEAGMYITWKEGWLQFSKENLMTVFYKLERYYNIKIITPKNFPSAELITGKLDIKHSLEEVLVALSDVAKIEYRIDNDNVFIDKKMKKINR
ncbi:MAG: FecR family protein [Draconibacterium sp.]